MQAGVTPKLWRTDIALSPVHLAFSRTKVMKDLRTLLQKPVLDAPGVQELMTLREVLEKSAFHQVKRTSTPHMPAGLIMRRGLRLLVFDLLYTVVQVVDSGLPGWWQTVADTVLKECAAPPAKALGADIYLSATWLTLCVLRWRNTKAAALLQLKRFFDLKKNGCLGVNVLLQAFESQYGFFLRRILSGIAVLSRTSLDMHAVYEGLPRSYGYLSLCGKTQKFICSHVSCSRQ